MPAARRVRFLPLAIRKLKEQLPFLFASFVVLIAALTGTWILGTSIVLTRGFVRRAIEAGWMG